MTSNEETLELTFALKHIEQHLLQNDSTTKKLLKLQQRIVSKEKLISCKGATKIYQAYDSLLQDIQNNLNTIEHALRLCAVEEEENTGIYQADVEMNNESEDIIIKEDDTLNEERDELIPVDTLVAALTLTGEGSEEWILARVKSFNGNSYTVEDAEVEEEPSIEIAQKEIYNVDPKHIILIPDDLETALARSEFKLRQNVLALFPGTTCFYSSIVMSQPSRRKKTRDYLLKFADDDVPSRPCSARYVLPFPTNK